MMRLGKHSRFIIIVLLLGKTIKIIFTELIGVLLIEVLLLSIVFEGVTLTGCIRVVNIVLVWGWEITPLKLHFLFLAVSRSTFKDLGILVGAGHWVICRFKEE